MGNIGSYVALQRNSEGRHCVPGVVRSPLSRTRLSFNIAREVGFSARFAMQRSGHSTESVYRRYAILVEEVYSVL